MDKNKLLKIISWNPIILGFALFVFTVTRIIDDYDEYNVWSNLESGDYNYIMAIFMFGITLSYLGLLIRKNNISSLYAITILYIAFSFVLILMALLQIYNLFDGRFHIDAEFTLYFSSYLIGFSYSFVLTLLLIHIIREKKI